MLFIYLLFIIYITVFYKYVIGKEREKIEKKAKVSFKLLKVITVYCAEGLRLIKRTLSARQVQNR